MTAARIRLALPLLTRHGKKRTSKKIKRTPQLEEKGSRNLSAWSYLAHLARVWT
jgi:hypothetical protein